MRNRIKRALRAAQRELLVPPPPNWTLADPKTPSDRWGGRVCVVTGAAGMIGSELVRSLLAQGAEMVAVDHDDAGLERLSGSVGAANCERLLCEAIDITSAAQTTALSDRLERVDVVIHCAVYNDYSARPGALTDEEWHRVIDVNLVASTRLTMALLGQLEEASGNVVMLLSVHGIAPSQWPAYGASKAMLGKLTVDLASQLVGRGVRVNGVAPGRVRPIDADPSERATLDQPLGHGAVPIEAVVHAVEFLADNERSASTTGQQLVVDAGRAFARHEQWPT